MNAIVIEHVKVEELPQAWRAKLAKSADTRVTVRIEEEAPSAAQATEAFVTDDPAFGIWRDHEDMADVAAYVRKIRAGLQRRHCRRRGGVFCSFEDCSDTVPSHRPEFNRSQPF